MPQRRTTVNYTTVNGTATAPSDYVAKSGTLVFPRAGPGPRTSARRSRGTSCVEPTEIFKVRISDASGASIADNVGQITVTDDDTGPGISINNVARNEGWLANNLYTFNVSLSAASPQTVTVPYSTASGSAFSGSDFVGTGRDVDVPARGDPEDGHRAVNGDLFVEGHEEFFVNLGAPSNATISDGQGVGTIFNDDCHVLRRGHGRGVQHGRHVRRHRWRPC